MDLLKQLRTVLTNWCKLGLDRDMLSFDKLKAVALKNKLEMNKRNWDGELRDAEAFQTACLTRRKGLMDKLKMFGNFVIVWPAMFL